MNRPNQRQSSCNVGQNHKRFAQRRGIVNVGRAVQGHDTEPLGIVDEAFGHAFEGQGFPWLYRVLSVAQQRVDHHVADKANAFRRNPLAGEILSGAAFGGVEQVRNLVGKDAIDLLGHAAIVASKPGFDVNNGHQFFAGDQAARQSGIHVADDDDAAGSEPVKHGLESPHGFRGLRRMASRPDLEIQIGWRKLEVDEQSLVHRHVVVLAGMNQRDCREIAAFAERSN